MSKHQNRFAGSHFIPSFKIASLITAVALFALVFCIESNAEEQSNNKKTIDDDLLTQFIKANNYSPYIVFDASNIKMFWVDTSVFAKDDLINILLSQKDGKKYASIPFNVQLGNVNERMDCKISVISENPNVSFSISDSKKKVISQSDNEQEFLKYTVISSLVHLEDTPGKLFKIAFQSDFPEIIKIKAIVMSFEQNKKSSFLMSPGKLNISKDNSLLSDAKLIDNGSFTVTGKKGTIVSKESIFVNDNTFSLSVKVKNVGNTATRVYVGYMPFSTSHFKLSKNIFPYKGINKILHVVECDTENNAIIVDSYTEWKENCYVELAPNSNLYEIKSATFLRGRVKEIKKRTDDTAEIVLTQPIDKPVKPGDSIRINSNNGGFAHTNKTLQPGQEEIFTSTIKKDDTLEEYSMKAFLKYFYFVKPLIIFSTTGGEESTVTITDFSVSF